MLTNTECKNAVCPEGKTRIRLSDSGNLYLEVAATGSKRWFWKYTFDGKEKRLALGMYPATSLKDARIARDDARRLHQSGIDAAQQRRLDKLSRRVNETDSFEGVAREYHSTKVSGWREQHGKRWLERHEKDVFPWLGSLAIGAVTAPLLLHTFRRVEARGVQELAHSLHEASGQVFRYGIATGRCERTPSPLEVGHHAVQVTTATADIGEPPWLSPRWAAYPTGRDDPAPVNSAVPSTSSK